MNEILVMAGGAPEVRYIELWNEAGGCLFPTTQVQVFDGAGGLVGAVAPAASTQCFGPGTYFLLATGAAAAFFGVDSDYQAVPALAAGAGQVCVVSSGTRYDCVRWGGITTAVRDFFGPDDESVASAPWSDVALARVATTHVIMDDWIVAMPTPGAANDGEPVTPPDAGPGPDAGAVDAGLADAGAVDAGLVDAGMADAALVDARVRPDARGPSFLDLDAVGGASCGCGAPGDAGAGAGGLALVLGALAALRLILRRRRPGAGGL